MTKYIATIHKEQHSEYGVQFYDFPGCITAGNTIEEAQIMATEALTGHLKWMLEDEDEISTPSSLEVILTDPDHQDAIAFLVIEIADDQIEPIVTKVRPLSINPPKLSLKSLIDPKVQSIISPPFGG